MWCTDYEQDLAEMRRCWGDAYRITWDDGGFRATHIVSGQILDASSATELRKLIRDHHSRHWASPGFMPRAGSAPLITAVVSLRRDRT
jgi:hypothetical protein